MSTDSDITTWLTAIEQLKSELAECRETLANAEDRMQYNHSVVNGLRHLMGYVQDGTETTVILFQDDATRDFIVKVGNTSYVSGSMESAILKALQKENAP